MNKITDHIMNVASQRPNHIALFDTLGEWTYQELWADVEAKIHTLDQRGVRPGHGIGVLGANSRSFITSMLAVMHAEAVALPISHNLKPQEVQQVCQRTKLHFLWSENSLDIESLVFSSTKCHHWYWAINKRGNDTLPCVPHVPKAAFIRFTSGTTGLAKGVVLSHQSIIERTESANEILRLDHTDIIIWVLSMAYHFVVSILLYLRYGSSICICENFMGDYIISRTNELNGTFLYVSPMHVKMLSRDMSPTLMPSLKRVISTSMGIERKLCQAFQERFDLPITQAFGSIEIGLPIVNTDDALTNPQAIGRPLPAYDVRILTDEGSNIDNADIGHLAISGPGMFDAYLDPPISREEAKQFGYFLTGDLASKDENGEITIVGRKKNVINVSGNKAFPEEIENVINQFIGVKQSRVSGFAHPLLSECVQADVVMEEGVSLQVEELITFCRKRLSTYKIPQRIHVVESLEKTDSGKIKR